MKLYCLNREICSYEYFYTESEQKESKDLFVKCPICSSLAINTKDDNFVFDPISLQEIIQQEK